MIGLDGIRRLQWVSSGGCQITARIFVAHQQRVCEAWHPNESARVIESEVSILRGPYQRPIPFLLEKGA